MPEISLSPSKRLYVDGDNLHPYPTLVEAFQHGPGHGLLYLDIASDAFTEQDSFIYWKDFGRRYLSLFAATPNLEQRDLKNDPITIPIPNDELSRWVVTVPPMRGAKWKRPCVPRLLSMAEIYRHFLPPGTPGSELLFKLRNVDHTELIDKVSLHVPTQGKGKVIQDQDLSSLFGIDIADETPAPVLAKKTVTKKTKTVKTKKVSAKKKIAAKKDAS